MGKRGAVKECVTSTNGRSTDLKLSHLDSVMRHSMAHREAVVQVSQQINHWVDPRDLRAAVPALVIVLLLLPSATGVRRRGGGDRGAGGPCPGRPEELHVLICRGAVDRVTIQDGLASLLRGALVLGESISSTKQRGR